MRAEPKYGWLFRKEAFILPKTIFRNDDQSLVAKRAFIGIMESLRNALAKEYVCISASAHKTYQDAIDYYQKLRDAVYARTAKHVGAPARIERVTFNTAVQADNWSNLSGPNNRQARATWSWADAYHHY